jgi:uncharacterized membrane protein
MSESPANHGLGKTLVSSRTLEMLARIGLGARGITYLLMGWLTVLVAMGGHEQLDQRGVLTAVLAKPLGGILVLLMAVGLAAYALWRLVEAAFGVTGEGNRLGPRIKSLARGLTYAFLSFTAIALLYGAHTSQSKQESDLARSVMNRTGGRWVVAIVGIVIVLIGLEMVREGFKTQFLQLFKSIQSGLRQIIAVLGRVGTIARGVVFTTVGTLTVSSAWSANALKAGGINEALRTLLHQQFGRQLVFFLGVGLMIFGVYGLAEARWQRVTKGETS